MSWTDHGAESPSFYKAPENAKPVGQSPPAVAAHCGRLWCLWQDRTDEHLCIAATTEDGQQFAPRETFPCSRTGRPMLVSLNEQLHAIILHSNGITSHYTLTNGEQKWKFLCGFHVDNNWRPSIYAFHGRLYLAYVLADALYCKVWKPEALGWTDTCIVPRAKDYRICEDYAFAFLGSVSLFVMDGALHLLYNPYKRETHKHLLHIYDEDTQVWRRIDYPPEGKLTTSANYACYGDTLYMATSSGNTPCISKYSGGVWDSQESLINTNCPDWPCPRIAILNGRLHAIFIGRWPALDLHWYSRPILDYSPSSWMSGIPDDTLLSNMTIPGTHDSPARTTIPFTKTQNLTITQQLALGIRFFDLRLRLHKDGRLYCYHGGIPLGWPRTLSFESVMDEIWTFLSPPSSSSSSSAQAPTETVLVSINNDNNSRGIGNAPAIFYSAIAAAIAATPAYADGTPRWAVDAVTPRLGDVRGRAVLLRRYPAPGVRPALRHGLDLSAWVNDSPNFTIVTPTGVVLRLQDKWRYSERISLRELVASKSAFVEAMFRRAMWSSSSSSSPSSSYSTTTTTSSVVDGGDGEGADNSVEAKADGAANPDSDLDSDSGSDSGSDISTEDGFVLVRRPGQSPPPNRGEIWFINFCSAVGEPTEHGEVAQARWVAVGGYSNAGEWIDGVNVSIGDYLRKLKQGATTAAGRQRRRLGIVPMDYPELPQGNDLVSQLIETNF